MCGGKVDPVTTSLWGKFIAAGTGIGMLVGAVAWVNSRLEAPAAGVRADLSAEIEAFEEAAEHRWEAHDGSHDALTQQLDTVQRSLTGVYEMQQVTIGLIAADKKMMAREGYPPRPEGE